MRAFETTVELSPADAEAAVRAALADQGFGVLTEIDVAATLKAKLGVDRPPRKILGACNPTLASHALEIDPAVSLLLPCNVVVEQRDGRTYVAAVDPHDLMDDPRFAELADEAASKLRAAINALGES
ncbi:MAG: DUF302 domain-containing protein [Acidimicrobiales bacterium]